MATDKAYLNGQLVMDSKQDLADEITTLRAALIDARAFIQAFGGDLTAIDAALDHKQTGRAVVNECPHCGRENFTEPAGHIAPCGRRVGYGDAPGVLYPAEEQWRERMALVEICRAASPKQPGAK